MTTNEELIIKHYKFNQAISIGDYDLAFNLMIDIGILLNKLRGKE